MTFKDCQMEWANWPWQRCWAFSGTDQYGARCDLKKRHEGCHIAERGLIADICWVEEYVPLPKELYQDYVK